MRTLDFWNLTVESLNRPDWLSPGFFERGPHDRLNQYDVRSASAVRHLALCYAISMLPMERASDSELHDINVLEKLFESESDSVEHAGARIARLQRQDFRLSSRRLIGLRRTFAKRERPRDFVEKQGILDAWFDLIGILGQTRHSGWQYPSTTESDTRSDYSALRQIRDGKPNPDKLVSLWGEAAASIVGVRTLGQWTISFKNSLPPSLGSNLVNGLVHETSLALIGIASKGAVLSDDDRQFALQWCETKIAALAAAAKLVGTNFTHPEFTVSEDFQELIEECALGCAFPDPSESITRITGTALRLIAWAMESDDEEADDVKEDNADLIEAIGELKDAIRLLARRAALETT